MKVKTSAQRLHHAVAVLLCFLLSPVSALSFGDNNTSSFEPVGKITGLVSIATRNQTNSNIRDVVRANDSLSTNKSGRMRIELQDGSTLNVGFESDLKIVKHSPATGETTVDLVDGRLRSRVVRVRKSGSKFVVTTPNATISAIGTDFFLDVSHSRTHVIVYSGVVVVMEGRGVAQSPARFALDVAAGQNVWVDGNGISRLQLTPDDVEQETIAETVIPDEVANSIATDASTKTKHSHLRRNVLLGVIAGGAIVGALAARGGSPSSSSAPANPPPTPTIPAQ
ncbi:MAG TPA: FecR domain-containing protein [Terriglobales bacterium]|nr:FecR domain-containing protein [Terriglobales bacterium]